QNRCSTAELIRRRTAPCFQAKPPFKARLARASGRGHASSDEADSRQGHIVRNRPKCKTRPNRAGARVHRGRKRHLGGWGRSEVIPIVSVCLFRRSLLLPAPRQKTCMPPSGLRHVQALLE